MFFPPSCKPPNAGPQEVDDLVCGICQENIEEECKVVGCDLCNKWYHSKCTGPDELVNLLEAIIEDEGNQQSKFLGLFLWVCPKCNELPSKYAKHH